MPTDNYMVLERALAMVAAIYLTYLGHSLFRFGVLETDADIQAKGVVRRLLFSGTGAGLFLMTVGAVLLLFVVYISGANYFESLPEKVKPKTELASPAAAPSPAPTDTPESTAQSEPSPTPPAMAIPSIPLADAGLDLSFPDSPGGEGTDTKKPEEVKETAMQEVRSEGADESREPLPRKEPRENLKVDLRERALQK
jgi:pyruvate/2-oxoglutarate dehydrogenase complex dihydrolipoamide acyltransferase (E2) component